MTITVTDLFCGAGGSSLGAESVQGVKLTLAANHWTTAIDVHQANFPDAAHDCADISQVDPRRYPRTDILLASPECTNHSQAKGVSRKKQDPTFWDAPDPAAERSRATMWDVPRFAEQMHYPAIVVENVVEATKWAGWRGWHVTMEDLGYEHRVLSHNSMHHGVPQSRDRIYVVFWKKGLRPNLEMEHTAFCPRCDAVRTVRQGWKNGRTVGRYKQQWMWCCTTCHTSCDPGARPAAEVIDWGLPCPRIGDRLRPLAEKTRDRILAGLERFGWEPIITAGAGNVYETTPGNRARPLTDPMPTQQTTATAALVQPPSGAFLFNTAHSGRVHELSRPHPTVCANDDRLSMVIPLRSNGRPWPTTGPIPTVTSGGNHHGLLMPYYSTSLPQPTDRPVPTVTTKDRCAVIDPQAVVDDCGFRMLEPHEVAAAMAFPEGYIPRTFPKKDQVKLAGNAVTPPVMQWLVGRVAQALESAA